MSFDPESDLQIFDPEITTEIARQREMHQDAFDGFLMSILQNNIVDAIDFHVEMVTHSLALFAFIADHTEDTDPYSEWASIATKELEDKDKEAREYLHNFLAQAGLPIDREPTKEHLKKWKDPEYRKEREQLAKQTFENWKKDSYIKEEFETETDEEFIKGIKEEQHDNFDIETDDIGDEFSDDDIV